MTELTNPKIWFGFSVAIFIMTLFFVFAEGKIEDIGGGVLGAVSGLVALYLGYNIFFAKKKTAYEILQEEQEFMVHPMPRMNQ